MFLVHSFHRLLFLPISIQDFCHDKEFARVDTNSGRRFKTEYSEARGDSCCLRRWNGFFGRCDPELLSEFKKSKHWNTFLSDNPGKIVCSCLRVCPDPDASAVSVCLTTGRTDIGTTKFLEGICPCCHSGDHRACSDTVIVELEVRFMNAIYHSSHSNTHSFIHSCALLITSNV